MKLNKLKVLSENDINQIHEASINILENVGLYTDSKMMLDYLDSKGLKIDYDRKLIKFPRDVVEKCIDLVPDKVPVYDRELNQVFTLGDGNPRCASGHNAVFVLEKEDGTRRPSTVKDVEDFAIISDYLDDIDMVGVPVMPQDVTPQTTLLYAIKAILENSKKPIFFSSESAVINKAAIDMVKLLAGKDDISDCCMLISQLSTTSPLYWEKGAVEALYEVSKAGMPVTFLPQPFTGVTAPYTLAGILTLHNAEVLSGVVISELINPGIPLIYGSAWTTYEMKASNVLIGRPEAALLRVAGAQMAHYYGMVSHTIGPDADSNLHDEQNGWEKMLTSLTGLVGDNDLIVNSGMFGIGMTISLEQLVMDNEINRMVKRLMKGIEVNKDTIAYDTIAKVGPKGNFLMEDHTLRYLRSDEHIELDVPVRENYEVWRSKGKQSVVDKARDIVEDILDKGNKSKLEADKVQELSNIIDRYEDMLNVKKKKNN